ncbi:BglG family transcription antiterminator [Oceanobacillus sp. CFH 90083]|uniref:BglG family transcription antiterminator n=1 Tax=Oceanobacillus sp. CFH 90083 TaxID=2592336 RepID=UPI00128B5FCA|nr:BglG family transcription antiterminator [Oceanobacillus sp. CFH 90083]
MDQRSMAVLNQLLKQDGYITVQKLAAMLNVSRRTIYSDLVKVNDWLSENHLEAVKQVRGQGLYIEHEAKKAILAGYSVSDIPYYEFSAAERQAWIYLHLTGANKAYFLKDIRELFQVSRNTALEDIRKLKNKLKPYQLHLYSQRRTGYHIEGKENDIRRVLIHCLSIVIPKEGWYNFLTNVSSAGDQAYKPYAILDLSWMQLLNQLLNEYEKQFMVELTDEVLTNIVVWFYFFLKRIVKEEFVEVDAVEKEVIQATDEYRGVCALCSKLSAALQIEIPLNEQLYFSKYLLGAKVNYNFNPGFQSEEMKTLIQVVKKMVRDFQLYAAIEFRDAEQMMQNLLLHAKPAFYRMKYGIEIENTLRDSVKRNYPEVFHLTKKVVHHFENVIGKPINENEIAFLAMHFGGWLRKEGVQLGKTQTKMLIVCTNGLGTSRLLESQLKGLFSDVKMIGVTSLREYEKMNLDVDFIVSTIPLPDQGVPVFVVNPVLDNKEKEQLLKKVNILFSYSQENQIYSVETLMDIVKKYAVVEHNELLSEEIRSYLQSPFHVGSKTDKPTLMELLPSDRIVLKKQAEGWKEAIKLASEPLLNQEYIKETYLNKMIENVHQSGPYIIISDQFALPHATPDDGVVTTGMSMLHLDEPVDILGKPATIIVILASKDNEQHLKALSQLTKLFSNKEAKKEIIATRDKQVIMDWIQRYSTEANQE